MRRLRTPVAATLALMVAAPSALAMGLFPNCLDTLTTRTKYWSECTSEFGRDGRECRQATQNMWNSMQTCDRKGYSKAEIDQAMAHGASIAGRKRGAPEPAAPPPPPPRPKSGPIPGIKPPAKTDN
jgi:hypothetical protein